MSLTLSTISSPPVDQPRWATSGVNRTAPTEGKKDSGWTVGEAPSSAFFNWLQFTTNEWLVWVDESIAFIDEIGAARFDISLNQPDLPPLNASPNDFVHGDMSRPFTQWNRSNANDAEVAIDLLTGLTSIVGWRITSRKENDSLSNALVFKAFRGDTGTFQNVMKLTLGADAYFYDDFHIADKLFIYGQATTPAGAPYIGERNQSNAIAASCKQTSGTATPATATCRWNVSGISRISQGYYQITLDHPVEDDAIIIATSNTFGSFAAAQMTGSSPIGTKIEVQIETDSGTNIDSPFSFMVIGRPRAGYTAFAAGGID